MRPRELGVVLFTFFGLYLLYEGILFSAEVLTRVVEAEESRGLFDPDPHKWWLLLAFSPVALGLSAGVICIVCRNLLSDRLFGDLDERLREAPSPVAPEDWRALWVGLIGVVFVVLALRDIAYTGAQSIIRAVREESPAFAVWPRWIQLGVQLVLGLFLVLGAPGLVEAWTRLRSAGRVRE